MTSPEKLCECGCGRPTSIAKMTNRRYGHIQGKPVRFVVGHSGRTGKNADQRVLDPETGCHIWTGSLSEGYGQMGVRGKRWHTHRWYYTQKHGPLPERVHLHHLCGNRACCNPDHLEVLAPEDHAGGAGHGKLDAAQAEQIRVLYAAGAGDQYQLAERFGVSQTQVWRIVRRHRWKVAV